MRRKHSRDEILAVIFVTLIKAVYFAVFSLVLILSAFILYKRMPREGTDYDLVTVFIMFLKEAPYWYTEGFYFPVLILSKTSENCEKDSLPLAFFKSLIPSALITLAILLVDHNLVVGWMMEKEGAVRILGRILHTAIAWGGVAAALYITFYPGNQISKIKIGREFKRGFRRQTSEQRYSSGQSENRQERKEYGQGQRENAGYGREERRRSTDQYYQRHGGPSREKAPGPAAQGPRSIPLEDLLTYPKEKMRIEKDIFAGCSEEASKAKYKALSRKFHPDSAEGDKDAMINIDTQYREYRERFKGSEKGGGHVQT